MLRIVVSLVLLIGISGCNKNWSGVVIEKRLYMDGYYVHVPWKRNAPISAYPKPQPYPVNHARNGKSDTTNHSGLAYGSPQRDSATPTSPGNYNTAAKPSQIVPVNQAAANSATPPLQPIPESPDPALGPRKNVPDSLHNTQIAADPILPGTDTSAIADVTPQHDKRFEFPDGTFALTAELGFFNSLRNDDIRLKPLRSFSCAFGFRYSFPVSAHHDLAAGAAFTYSLCNISQKQEKQLPLYTEHYKKERITVFKIRIFIADQITISQKEETIFKTFSPGGYVEYNVLSTHIGYDFDSKSSAAQFSTLKKREFGLSALCKIQFGTTIRISNDEWSLFANYRLSDMVKRNPNDVPITGTIADFPALVIGAEYQFGK